ncbi:hypothetical protein BBP40_002895 [Aspergillus hancockii]|nr:hypothetical protein BBP40_002895 [Aspergillus hancockii]
MLDEGARFFIYQRYKPPGVKRVIASGSSAFVGEVDETTVLNFTLAPGGDMSRLEVERKLLDIVGPHERSSGSRPSRITGSIWSLRQTVPRPTVSSDWAI